MKEHNPIKIKDIISFLESKFPPALQENYDNSGLLVGSADEVFQKAIISIDFTEDVLQEALNQKANLIITHHPLIFKGLKKLTGSNSIEKLVISCIKNNLSLYAIHTNFDNLTSGTNSFIASRLGLLNAKVLRPLENQFLKLVVFCPVSHANAVRQAIFESGAGTIGYYDNCSFNVEGLGSFRASDEANPFVGTMGENHFEPETRIETILPKHLKNKVLKAMIQAHPYEEVAYDLYPVENHASQIGAGVIGDLPEAIEPQVFLKKLKEITSAACIRHTQLVGNEVKRVALCGGSGAFLISDAIRQNADAYITGDIKYHEFFDANGKLILCDIGHYESEQFTKEILCDLLKEKFPTFAFLKSDIVTNPINYF
ncbi:MAG: Nif3-like dinuclear metal center hexameric protein [Bacteroidales bacterium]|nr:Nif3-like dinuclear metal center hexameric protein [Bacteroidales bacterium]